MYHKGRFVKHLYGSSLWGQGIPVWWCWCFWRICR